MEYQPPENRKELTQFYNYHLDNPRPIHVNGWWDDHAPKQQVLYGPNGEVLSKKTEYRRIGFYKDGY